MYASSCDSPFESFDMEIVKSASSSAFLALILILTVAGCDSTSPPVEKEPAWLTASPPRPIDFGSLDDWSEYRALKVGNLWEYERTTPAGVEERWRETVLREGNVRGQSGVEILYELDPSYTSGPTRIVRFLHYDKAVAFLSCASGWSTCSLSDVALIKIGDDSKSSALLNHVTSGVTADSIHVSQYMKRLGLIRKYHHSLKTETRLVHAVIDGKVFGESKRLFRLPEADAWREYAPMEIGHTWEFKEKVGSCDSTGEFREARYEVSILADSTVADGSRYFLFSWGQGPSIRRDWVQQDPITRTARTDFGYRYYLGSGVPFGPCGDCEESSVAFENGERTDKRRGEEISVFRENVGPVKYSEPSSVTEFELGYSRIFGVETGESLPTSSSTTTCN